MVYGLKTVNRNPKPIKHKCTGLPQEHLYEEQLPKHREVIGMIGTCESNPVIFREVLSDVNEKYTNVLASSLVPDKFIYDAGDQISFDLYLPVRYLQKYPHADVIVFFNQHPEHPKRFEKDYSLYLNDRNASRRFVRHEGRYAHEYILPWDAFNLTSGVTNTVKINVFDTAKHLDIDTVQIILERELGVV